MKRLLLPLFAVLVACPSALAQIKTISPDSLTFAETSEKVLQFRSLTLDGGTLKEDDEPVEYVFGFTNTSSGTVVITKVRTDCSCLSAKVQERSIAPGESGNIVLSYSPHGRNGSFLSKAYVHTDRSPQVEAVLTLKIKVEDDSPYPYRMGRYALGTKEIVFESGRAAKAPVAFRALSEDAPGMQLRDQFLPDGLKAVLQKDCITIEYDGKTKKGEYPLYIEAGERQTKVTIRIK
ncbi:MAG: DUF1573 domain-containing protein [Candidatus Cryptobacteroides sp.]